MFKCDICGKEFKTSLQLRGHKSSHNRKPRTKEVACINCEDKFTVIASSKKKFCSLDCTYNYRRKLRDSKKMVMANGDEIDLTVKEADFLRQKALKCEICGRPESHTLNGRVTSLSLDHDHKTKRFRGFLCSSCNRNLGWFENYKDSIELYLGS